MENAKNHSAAPALLQRGLSRVVLIGLFAGILIHLLGFLIFRVVYRELPSREEHRPFVQYRTLGPAAGENGISEQAALLDSAPLFIPTRWNAAQAVDGPSFEARIKVFDSFSPPIDLLAALGPGRFLGPSSGGVSRPEDLLASRFWRFFSRFGENPPPVRPFAAVGVYAEVVPFDAGMVGSVGYPLRIEVELGREIPVPVTAAAEFHFRAAYGDVYSQPVLVRSSGNEEFDAAIREWLTRPEVMAQLPPEYSKVTVYP